MSDNIDEKLERFIESVDSRLRIVEERLDTRDSATGRSYAAGLQPNQDSQTHVALCLPPLHSDAAGQQPQDLQGDFQALRDSLCKVKIPAEVRLSETKQGIRRSNQPLLNVLTKCGHYCETRIQLLCTLDADSTLTQDTLDSLFLIQHAQIKYLQKEFASLLVSGQFDTSTLQKNTSGFDQDSLDTLRSAATLAAAGRAPAQADDSDRSYRRGRGSYNNGFGRGQRQYGQRQDRDAFHSLANRQFPSRRHDTREDNPSGSSADN